MSQIKARSSIKIKTETKRFWIKTHASSITFARSTRLLYKS